MQKMSSETGKSRENRRPNKMQGMSQQMRDTAPNIAGGMKAELIARLPLDVWRTGLISATH